MPSGARCLSRLATLFAYSRLAWNGIWLGRLSVPSIVTPSRTTTSPGSVSSQLPPVSAAMSTSTEPGRMRATISAVMSFGAGRPGTAAVVITQSAAATRSASSSRWRRWSSSESSFAYCAGAAALALLLHLDLDELGAEALDLLLDRRPHVVGLDHRAEPLRGRDRLQARDARAEHQHARGLRRCRRR